MGTVYRIREWESRYEVNSKNRVWTDGDEKRAGALEYIRLPVSGHLLGKGFRRLNRVAGKNAPAVFGVFVKLLEIAGDNSHDLRGLIVEFDGKPMDAASIAETLDWDENTVQKALNTLCDKDLGWVECVEAPGLSRTFPEISGKSRSRSETESESYTESETDTDQIQAPPTPQGGHGGGESDSPNESPANPPSTIAEFRTETPRHSQNGSAVASAQHQEAKTPYKPTESGTDTPSSIMEAWNALADMPGVRLERAVAFTAKRKASARERLRDAYFRENWRAALDKIRADKFYQGCGDRGWIAGIDYFLRPDTVAKIMEKSKGVMGPPDGWFAGEFEGFEDGVEAMRRKRAQHAAA